MYFFLASMFFLSCFGSANVGDASGLLDLYKKPISTSVQEKAVQQATLNLANKAVPTLIHVIKEARFSEKNRWMAAMLLGRIMGEKSSPFMAKFAQHPHWMMRTAALKNLLIFKQKEYESLFVKALRDPSLIVRAQALENIRVLKLQNSADEVWKMLFNEANYSGKNGQRKRGNIVRHVILTLGELKYQDAKPAFLKMIQNSRYMDLSHELDKALSELTGKISPVGNIMEKREFWKRQI